MTMLKMKTRRQLLSLLPSVVDVVMITSLLLLSKKLLMELKFRSTVVLHITYKN